MIGRATFISRGCQGPHPSGAWMGHPRGPRLGHAI